MAGINDFSLKGVVGASRAETRVGVGVLGVGVSGLHHELVDDAVEQHAVVIFLFDEFQEIVAVGRGVAEEVHPDVAYRGLDVDQRVTFLDDGGFGCELGGHDDF